MKKINGDFVIVKYGETFDAYRTHRKMYKAGIHTLLDDSLKVEDLNAFIENLYDKCLFDKSDCELEITDYESYKNRISH